MRGRIALSSVKSDIKKIAALKNPSFQDAQPYFMLVSNLMDFIWYLTDHYSVAHLLKLVDN